MPASITPMRSGASGRWAAALSAASDAELVALLERRADLRRASPASFGALAAALTSQRSAIACYQRLDRAARQVAEAICVLGGETSRQRLAEVLACDAASFEPVLERLADVWLVIEERGTLLVNPGVASGLRHPAHLGRPLRPLLLSKTGRELGEIAARLSAGGPKVTGRPGAKAARSGAHTVLEIVSEVLSDPAALAALFEGAPDGAEELARRVALSGPIVELGYSYSAYARHESDNSATGWLVRRGILVSPSWGTAEMPAEVAIALRGGLVFPNFAPEPPQLDQRPVDQEAVDSAGAHCALKLVRDLVTLVGSLGEVPAKLLKDGGVGVRELRRLSRLCEADEASTAFLLEVAAAAGLVDTDPYGGLALPTAAFDRFLELATEDRWRLVAESWLAAPGEIGLSGSHDAEGKPIPALAGAITAFAELSTAFGDVTAGGVAAARRRLLATVLASLPPARAVSAEQLGAHGEWSAPALFELGFLTPSKLAERYLAESSAVGASAGGAATSFGRLLVSGKPAEAAALLGRAAPPVVSEIIVQADMTAIAPGELPWQLRADLELIADVESSGAATVYRFSEASLVRGLDAGWSSAEILELLERHAPRGVPQALRYLVEDLGRRHGRLRVGRAGCYVRCDEPAVLEEIASTRRLARLGLRLLAPTVLVSSAEPPRLRDALREAGYLAAGEDDRGLLVISRPAARRLPDRPDDKGAGGRPATLAALAALAALGRRGPAGGCSEELDAEELDAEELALDLQLHERFDDGFDDEFDDEIDDDEIDDGLEGDGPGRLVPMPLAARPRAGAGNESDEASRRALVARWRAAAPPRRGRP